MRFFPVVLYFSIGAFTGAVVTDFIWNKKFNSMVASKQSELRDSQEYLERFIFLNEFVHDCELAKAKKGLNGKDPARMESINFLTNTYLVAKYWNDKRGSENGPNYDYFRESIMTILELESPGDFANTKNLGEASVFVDIDDDSIKQDRVQLVVRFLADGESE